MIELNEITSADYDLCASFLANVFNQSKAYWSSRFHFIWDANPAYKEKLERGFIFKDGNKVVGFIGKYPTKFVSEGKETIAWNGTSLAVDVNYRSQKLGKTLRKKHFESCGDDILFATTPAKITLNMNRTLGFKYISHDVGPKSAYAIFPGKRSNNWLLHRKFIRKNYNNLKILIPNWLSGKKKQNSLFSIPQEKNKKITIRLSVRPRRYFNALWEKKASEFQFTNVRTSEVLAWYTTPVCGVETFLLEIYYLFDLIGYMLVKKTQFRSFPVMVIADTWFSSKFEFHEYIDYALYHINNVLCDKTATAIIYPLYKPYEVAHFEKCLFWGNPRQDLYVWPNDTGKVMHGHHYFTYNLGDKLIMPEFIINQ